MPSELSPAFQDCDCTLAVIIDFSAVLQPEA